MAENTTPKTKPRKSSVKKQAAETVGGQDLKRLAPVTPPADPGWITDPAWVTYTVATNIWIDDLRANCHAGTLGKMSAPPAYPRDPQVGTEIVLDIHGIHTIIAKWDGDDWVLRAEINP